MVRSDLKYRSIIALLVFFLVPVSSQDIQQLNKGGIGIDGLITINFPTPQQVADTYNEQCNLQTIDSVGFPVMCQQFGAFVFFQGRDKITNLGLFTIITSGIDPFGLMSEDNNLKKRIAIGTALMVVGASIVATCPPIPVDPGFQDLSAVQRLQQAQAFGYVPSAPPDFDLDVDDVNDSQSCAATLGVTIDDSSKEVINFGDFSERDFAYTSPFGSYPSATLDIAHLSAAFVSCNAALLSLIDISAGPSLSNNFTNSPSVPDINLSGILNGLVDTIFETIGMTEFEAIALGNFNSWKNNYRSQNPTYCTNSTCQYEHGDNRMVFYENMPANAWGNVAPKLEYYQDVNVMEYFNPEITALPLEVRLEALEIGGVTVNAYPPRSFTGTPPANKSYTFDKSWLGILDNCTQESELKLDFPVEKFYPLGNWDIPITLTDRVGNVTTDTMRIVIEDSIPPDLLPLDAIGIPVADGTTVINFDDPGIGCVTNLCEGFPSTMYLHPPVYFDFASISPDIECYVDNVLDVNLVPCTVAQLPVNDVSLITWSIADPSGNVTEITQEVFVREESFNQVPTVTDVNITIGQNSQVQIPLSGNDQDYDPLNFNVINQPSNGNLDAQVVPLFQTRFTTSGMLRDVSGMAKVYNSSGEKGILLSVPDEKRMYLFSGDILNASSGVVQRYELPTITPSAITFSRTKSKDIGSIVMKDVLKSSSDPIWIGDWQNRKIYRYTNNGLGTIVEKFIANVPTGIEQPSGLVVERNSANNQFSLIIADKQDNQLWRMSVTRNTNNSDLNQQSYTANYNEVITATLPFAVDAMDNWNSNNLITDYGEIIIVSWSEKQLAWFDWDDGGITEIWDISDLINDIAGPRLPILQDPRDIVLISDGSSRMIIELFDQAEMKYVQKGFIKSNHFVACGGSPPNDLSIDCINLESDVLRLPAMVNVLSIEEYNGLIYVLDQNIGDGQHLYRFDLAGRLDAIISLYGTAPSNSPLSPASLTEFVDLTIKDNGDVVLLEKGNASNAPSIQIVTVNSGVDNYHVQLSTTLYYDGSIAIALDINATDIVVLKDTGFTRIPLNNTNVSNQSLISASNVYNDLVLSDAGEIYASNRIDSPVNHVAKFSIDGTFISFIDSGNLDFNNDVAYGQMYFDNSLNKLWVSDFANVFYPDLGASGETHRMPRMSAYATDGTLLERLIPDGDPNDFFSFLQPGDFGRITSIAVGPNRFYVAESEPLKRLHVFDTSEFIPVICTNLPEGEVCQEIGYTPNNGFIGIETFTFAASDPFNANSNTATITINVIDDQQPPTLTCPNSISLEKNDATGFVADLVTPVKEPNTIMREFLLSIAVSENTDLPVVKASHNIPAALPLGPTTVIYLATDGSNNMGTCLTNITVVDTTPPAMGVLTTLIVEATSLQTPVANIGLVEPSVADFSPFLLTSNAPATFPIGETIVTWTAADNQGNSVQQNQVVLVQDTTPPEFIVAQVAADIFGSTITTVANYTPPQASDLVGINDAGIVCLPNVGAMIPMGPNLIRCHVSDNYGNKASSDFIINYFDVDSDGDGIINALDLGAGLFSDAANAGMTTGSINFPENINWQFEIYEAPTESSGVVIGVTYTPIKSLTTVNGVAHACEGKVIMDSLNNETIMFDDISVNTKDYVVVTCTISGYKVFSLFGTNDFTLTLPNSSTITAHMEFNNGLEVDGWLATAGIENRGNVSIIIAGKQYMLSPNQTIDLRAPEIIFINGFEQ